MMTIIVIFNFSPQTIVFDEKRGGQNSCRDEFLRLTSLLSAFESVFEIVGELRASGCLAGGIFIFLNNFGDAVQAQYLQKYKKTPKKLTFVMCS